MDSPKDPGAMVSLTLRELNHNHKYRMVLMLGPPPFYLLADLRVVKRDESLYLMPLIEREYTVAVRDAVGIQSQHQVRPNAGSHISLHDSGVVNASFGAAPIRLRHATGSPAALGPVFSAVVTSMAGLRKATDEQLNVSSAKKRVLPLFGAWRPGPVGMTLYRSTAGQPWAPPALSDAFQVNLHMPMEGKAVEYHLVVWQHHQFKPAGGDLEIYLM